MLELVVVKGPAFEGSVFNLALGQSFTLGRASDCNIKLASAGVSKQHCSLTPLSGLRVEIEDLGSANGTYVNGLLIKKHVLKPGDTISIHQFVLQLRKQAPQLVMASAPPSQTRLYSGPFPSNSFQEPAGLTSLGRFPSATGSLSTPETEKGNAAYQWLERNIFPIADRLAKNTNIVFLIFGSILIWSVAVSILSIQPFRDRANFRIQDQSIEVAKLYARQLARINLDSIIEQRYSNLVVQLDGRRGQTPGIVESLILDRVNGQVLAPSEKLGQSLPSDSPAAAIAVSKDTEFVGIDENSNTAFVVVPIIVGTPEGNKAVASAFVRFNYLQSQFGFASVLDQMLNSILLSLSFGWLLFALIYRWTEGTLQRSAEGIQRALKGGDNSIALPVRSAGAENLVQEIGFALSKASSAGNSSRDFDYNQNGNDWAISSVNNTGGAAAALDGRLTILAWNPRMAQLLNIQENVAVGMEISQASRDVTFEAIIRDLAQESLSNPWRNIARTIDIGGRQQMLSLVFGNGAFLVNVDPVGGDV